MKKIFSIFVFILLLNISIAVAQEEQEEEIPEAGIAPDSPLYGLDVAVDRIRLAIALNDERRAEIALGIAEERLSEVKAMIAANKEFAAERAEAEHGRAFERMSRTIEKVDDRDERDAIKFNARIRQKLELHKVRKAELAAGIEADLEGNLTEEQKERIGKLLLKIETRTSDVDMKLINKRDKLKIKLKVKLNKTDEEIEVEVEEIESNVTEGFNPEKVFELIEKAQEKIDEIKEKAEEKGFEFHAVNVLLNRSQKHLDKAVEAVEEKKYGAAFGQARASLALSKNAERILDNPEKFKGLKREVKELRELRIEQINETKELRKEQKEELREKIKELREERREKLRTITETEDRIEVEKKKVKVKIKEEIKIENSEKPSVSTISSTSSKDEGKENSTY